MDDDDDDGDDGDDDDASAVATEAVCAEEEEEEDEVENFPRIPPPPPGAGEVVAFVSSSLPCWVDDFVFSSSLLPEAEGVDLRAAAAAAGDDRLAGVEGWKSPRIPELLLGSGSSDPPESGVVT